MGTHTVKAGENIFDIALKLYGGIEGVFDLLVQNTDADSHTGLSVADTLVPGTVLSYSDDFKANGDILGWLQKNGIDVRNGEHVFKHRNIVFDIMAYTIKHGTMLAEDGEALVISDIPGLIVKQDGKQSAMTFRMDWNGVVAIDWGDNTSLEIYCDKGKTVEAEHCYEDAGAHIIRIYLSTPIVFGLLDLTEIGGTYFPMVGIGVSDFRTSINDTILNKLITTI